MALEIRCPNCGRTLRIADEHAGKQVRCPACQQISTAVAATDPLRSSTSDTWHLKTPEGPIYGPISWREVQDWAAEGRITADCLLAESGSGPWQPAEDLLPHLRPDSPPQAARTTAEPAPPTLHTWIAPSPDGFAPGSSPFAPPASRGYLVPHRGGLILALGLIGFVVSCPIFSLMAWVMGSHDLIEMRAGRMDRQGEGMTQAGQVLGMILSALWILGGIVTLVVIGIIAIASSL
jgi:hypothetical protein